MQKRTLSQPEPSNRRRHRRVHVLFSGALVSADRTAPGLILDISIGGARLQLKERFDPRSAVILRLARSVDFPAEVAWRAGDVLGLRFQDRPARIAGTLAGLLPEDCLAA